MAGNVQTLPAGIQNSTGTPAAAVVSANTRVRSATWFLGTVTDVPTFPTPAGPAGAWTVPDQRTLVGGIPTISASSVGITVHPVTGTVGPMTVAQPDTRVSNG